MSALERALEKLSAHIVVDDTLPPSPPTAPEPVCELCGGRGMVGINAAPGHPLFGRLIPCPADNCPEGTKIRMSRFERMMSRAGLPDTYRSMTFDSFYELPEDMRQGKQLAAAVCWVFTAAAAAGHCVSLRDAALLATDDQTIANRYSPEGKNWIVLQGGLGMGKTGLAGAIVNEMSLASRPVLFFRMQELFSEIQSRYGRTESPTADELLIEVQRAPVLILDECNIPNVSADKTRLFEEIIRFRHGRSLPTVITCNVDQAGLAAMWGERTADVIYERSHWIQLTGKKLRRQGTQIASF